MSLNGLMVKRALQANYAWATQRMFSRRAHRWSMIIGADLVGIAVVLGALRVVGAIVSGAHVETATAALERVKHEATTPQLPLPPNTAEAVAFADTKPIAEKALIAAPPRASRDLVFAKADASGAAFPASPPAANRFSPPMSAERMNAAFAPSDSDEGTQPGDPLRIWRPAGDPQVVASLMPDQEMPAATPRDAAPDKTDATVTPSKPQIAAKPKTRRLAGDTQVALVTRPTSLSDRAGSATASLTGAVGAVAGTVGSSAQGAVGAVGGIAGGLGIGGR